MAVLQLGTIGTSMISDLFVKAALKSEKMALHAVYSRNLDKAETFGKPFGAQKYYAQLEDLFHDPTIDVIYIASPNNLHYTQTLAALKAKKHVIVEKPVFTMPKHWDEVEKVAKEQNRVVIEAIRHMHEPNFERLKEELQTIGEIKGATLPYLSYSSRYDLVRKGEEPNIFSMKFAGGALMDLGVYPIYTALALFGEPNDVHAFVQKVETGVDGIGTAILRYAHFDVTVQFGKIATSLNPAEIYGVDATLQFEELTRMETIKKIDSRTKEVGVVPTEEIDSNMLADEANVYAQVLLDPEKHKDTIKQWFELSKMVGRTMDKLRQSAGIEFPEHE